MHRASELRKRTTPAEALLWSCLRGSQVQGVSFRRQHAIGPYVVDFCSPRQKLIVELDGSPHRDRRGTDAARSAFLTLQGYRVLRFWNHRVMTETQAVLTEISEAIEND